MPEPITWQFLVDWDDDGTYDDVTEDVILGEGVTVDRGLDKARVLSPPMAAQMDLTLDNSSKRYSRENADGALYGELDAGHLLRIRGAELWFRAYNPLNDGNGYQIVTRDNKLGSDTTYTIVDGDFLEYDMYWLDPLAKMAPDIGFSGTVDDLKNQSAVDQNGLSSQPEADLTDSTHPDGLPYRQWYSRRIKFPTATVGATADALYLIAEKNEVGTYRMRLRDLRITTGGGVKLGQSGMRNGETCARFDGITGVITTDLDSGTASGEGTVECIVSVAENPLGHMYYCGWRNDDDADFYILQVLGTETLEVRYRDGTTNVSTTSTSLTPGRHHLALTMDGAHLTLYVDGVQNVQTACSGVSLATGASFCVGKVNEGVNTGNYYWGPMAHVAAYDSALSATRILAHANAIDAGLKYETEVSADSPVGWWKLTGADTGTAADSGSGDNDGSYTVHATQKALFTPETDDPTWTAGSHANYTDWWIKVPSIFHGPISDMQESGANGKEVVKVTALGMLSLLQGVLKSTDLSTDTATGTAMGLALDAASFSADLRDLDTGQSSLDYWWLQRQDVGQELVTLHNTEGPGALLFDGGDGKITFRDRDSTNVRLTTNQADFTPDGPLYIGTAFDVSAPLRDLITECTQDVTVRKAQASAVIWQAGADVTVGASTTQEIVAVAGDPLSSLETMTVDTDYTVTAGSVTSVTATQTSAQEVTVSIVTGASGATLSGLQVRGVALKSVSTQKIVSVDASATITKSYTLSTRTDINANTVQDFCDAVIAAYKNPRVTVTVPIDGGANDDLLWQAGTLDVGYRINVEEQKTSLNFPVQIQRLKYAIDEAGELLAVASCEKIVSTATFAAWGSAEWDVGVWGF